MSFTDKFRTQHNEILQIAKEMTAELKGEADPAILRKLLSNLAGKLNFHLAMGVLLQYSYLWNGYGPPVLGGLLALGIGGARLPFSLSGGSRER